MRPRVLQILGPILAKSCLSDIVQSGISYYFSAVIFQEKDLIKRLRINPLQNLSLN